LKWGGGYILQASTNAAGPYFDVSNVISSYSNGLALPQQFSDLGINQPQLVSDMLLK